MIQDATLCDAKLHGARWMQHYTVCAHRMQNYSVCHNITILLKYHQMPNLMHNINFFKTDDNNNLFHAYHLLQSKHCVVGTVKSTT